MLPLPRHELYQSRLPQNTGASSWTVAVRLMSGSSWKTDTMGSPRGDRGLYSAPRRGGCPRYASEIRPSGVTHRTTRWVVSLIAEHTVLQVPLEISQFISSNPVEISQCLTLYRTRGCAPQNLKKTLNAWLTALSKKPMRRLRASKGARRRKKGGAHAPPVYNSCQLMSFYRFTASGLSRKS